jgi:hypothetical protein
VIAQQPLRVRRPRAHRHPLPAGVVIPHHRRLAALPLEGFADINRRRTAFSPDHTVAIPVVAEARRRRPTHLGQMVLGIESRCFTAKGSIVKVQSRVRI